MALHLVKLCVGVETLDDLRDHIAARLALLSDQGRPVEQIHTTRMVPKRADALVDGGSLFWVIKGQVQARQRLLAIRPFTDGEGIGRCHLVLEPVLHATHWQPRRPFQGWRYLEPEDAPRDLGADADGLTDMPATLRRELAELGLI
jgi:hypothetical protein